VAADWGEATESPTTEMPATNRTMTKKRFILHILQNQTSKIVNFEDFVRECYIKWESSSRAF
jgi:hypothetical protein